MDGWITKDTKQRCLQWREWKPWESIPTIMKTIMVSSLVLTHPSQTHIVLIGSPFSSSRASQDIIFSLYISSLFYTDITLTTFWKQKRAALNTMTIVKQFFPPIHISFELFISRYSFHKIGRIYNILLLIGCFLHLLLYQTFSMLLKIWRFL